MLSKEAIAAARGIGILLVVLGHTRVPGIPPINPYGFHIPLFFFLSGMTLRVAPPFGALVVRDTKSLLLYTLLHFGIFAALTVLVFHPLGFSAITATSPLDWRTYFVLPFTNNGHHVQLFLIAWFLIALYFARALSLLVLKIFVRLPSNAMVAAVVIGAFALAYLGTETLARDFAESRLWYLNLAAQVAVGMAFCLLGYVAQNHATLVHAGKGVAIALLLYLFLMTAGFDAFIMAWSQYPGGFVESIAFGLIGTLMVLYAAHALRHQGWLLTIGQDSKAIMAWHLTAFATLNIVAVLLGKLQVDKIGVFTLYNGPHWWPVYLLSAIFLPIGVATLFRRLRMLWRVRTSGPVDA